MQSFEISKKEVKKLLYFLKDTVQYLEDCELQDTEEYDYAVAVWSKFQILCRKKIEESEQDTFRMYFR